MAKLADLKKLVDAARDGVATSNPEPAARSTVLPRAAKPSPAVIPRAGDDIDLAQAFADVQRLAPSTRTSNARPRPAPIPLQRIADDADVIPGCDVKKQ